MVAAAAAIAEVQAPPLECGDHLTRPEFERRYAAMPGLKIAELIEGIVYMPSPVSLSHSRLHAALVTWLGNYAIATPGIEAADNTSVRLDMDNEPQPDAVLFILPDFGGTVTIDPDDYISGAPDFVAEIAASTASIDLNAKLRSYQRNGVQEYVVILTRAKEIRWHTLHDGAFVIVDPTPDGLYRSITFPGLALDGAAMLRGDYVRVMERLREGIGSEEHEQFVRQLVDVRCGAVR